MRTKTVMVKCRALLLLISLLSATQMLNAQKLKINELLQSNIDGVMVDSDFPESWIELYNPTNSAIDLKTYRLSRVNDYSKSKALSGTVPAKGYKIIYCDESWSAGHFPYRLESEDPGTLYLFAGTKVIDQVEYPAMLAPGIAYARTTDGGSTWMHEVEATPEASNTAVFSELLLPEPEFSTEGGIMSSAITLTVSMPEGSYPEDTQIYYTLDGSEPTKSSASCNQLTLDVDHTVVVRAKLMSAEALSPRSTTHTYIYLDRPTDMAVFSIAIDEKYLYGNLGILTHYKTKWRRPINVECYDPTSQKKLFNQLGETALSGGGSREFAQKSMKCYAKKWFGEKRFHGVFWEDKPLVNKSKSFILRNGGNNSSSSKINDALVQKLFGTHLNTLDWQAYEPAIVYINGEYKGMFEWRERSNDDYIYSNYDGLEAIVSAEANLYTSKTPPTLFESFRSAYCKESTTYQDLEKLMDIDNFMDALIAEMYAANTDYPLNNIFMWRPTASNGRWRWILKDLDYMARNDVEYNMFKRMFSSATGSVSYTDGVTTPGNYSIYRKMISLPEFREQFIRHYTVYLGDFLKPSVATDLVNEMAAEISNEIPPTHAVYGYTTSWSGAKTRLKNYCSQRPGVIYGQMATFFSLGSVIPMKLTNNGKEIRIDDILLTEGNFDGSYFSDYPLTVSTGASNYSWRMNVTRSDNSIETYDFATPSVSLTLGDYGDMKSVAFEPLQLNMSEFEQKLASQGLQQVEQDLSGSSAIVLPEPRCAYVNITGIEELPIDKNDIRNAYLEMYDGNGNYFKKKIFIGVQGGTSSNLYKKSLAIGFCEDEWVGEETPDITFGDWVMQDEFHLKAFYNDYFRGIPAIGYKLYNQMVKHNPEGARYAWERGLTEADLADDALKTYEEARCFPDAFPCAVYFNGDYYGAFAWQLKKQRRNMNQTKDVATHIHLDGTLNDKQLFRGTVNWTKFEVRNPKDLYNMDGSDYDGDNPQELIDATSPAYTGKKKMVRCATVKQHVQELSQYYSEIVGLIEGGASEEDVRAAIGARFDVSSLVDYMLLSLVTSNYEGFSKNWQWFTYDAEKWFVAPYDLDLTFGYNEEMTTLWPASQSSKKYDYKMENVDTSGPMYWIKNYYWEDVKSRYAQLRSSGVLSAENIMTIVNDWYARIGDETRTEEWLRWPGSPCLTNFTDSPDRIEEWVTERLALEDDYLGYSPASGNYQLNVSAAEWATLCVPFTFDIPTGLTLYTVDGIAGDGITLELTEELTGEANKPYLVHAAAGQYELTGDVQNGGTLENGLLNGTLTDMQAPNGSYVLQSQSQVLGFYRVPESTPIAVPAYHAYLTPRGGAAAAFRISDGVSSCESIRNETSIEYYNLWGQRSQTPVSGVAIIRYSNGQSRKTMQ